MEESSTCVLLFEDKAKSRFYFEEWLCPPALKLLRTAFALFCARQLVVVFCIFMLAEGVGFEPTVAFTTPVFKTGLFDHSSTPPNFLDLKA